MTLRAILRHPDPQLRRQAARVVLHEYEHLTGKLIVDHARKRGSR